MERLREAKAHAPYDPASISWSSGLLSHLAANRSLCFAERGRRASVYRPFTKQHVYFDKNFNERRYQLPKMFPTPQHENYGFLLNRGGIAL